MPALSRRHKRTHSFDGIADDDDFSSCNISTPRCRPQRSTAQHKRSRTYIESDSSEDDFKVEVVDLDEDRIDKGQHGVLNSIQNGSNNVSDSDDDLVILATRPVPKKNNIITPFAPVDVFTDTKQMDLMLSTTTLHSRQYTHLPSIHDTTFQHHSAFASASQTSTFISTATAGELFKALPVELHNAIVSYLSTDKEVAGYSMICKQIKNTVSDSVWRQRFLDTYNDPGDLELENKVAHLSQLYRTRSEISRLDTVFGTSQFGRLTDHQRKYLGEVVSNNNCQSLSMFRDLIKESDIVKLTDSEGKLTLQSLNLDYFWKRCMSSGRYSLDILRAVGNTHDVEFWDKRSVVGTSHPDSLVLVIQLCLAPLYLHPGLIISTNTFDHSQLAAYSRPEDQPLFLTARRDKVNVRLLISMMKFFKFHLCAEAEGSMVSDYKDLDSDSLPQGVLSRPQDETVKLGGNWKGTYTWLDDDDLRNTRNSGGEEVYPDNNGGVHDICFFFDDDKLSSETWPATFERILNSRPYAHDAETFTPSSIPRATRSRSQRNVMPHTPKDYTLKAFFGSSSDQSTQSYLYGRIHALPPQQGIPGFQRISFLKFCCDADNLFDSEQVWKYEGCVIPGGNIIIGRWSHTSFHPQHDHREALTGPFILWNVNNRDPNLAELRGAMMFLDDLKELNLA